MRRNTSNTLPYVIVGSAVGSIVGYLFLTDSGRRVRESLNPNRHPETMDKARVFIDRNTKRVTDQVRGVLDRAKESVEAGQRAYRRAEERYRSQFHSIKSKNKGFAANAHVTVDKLASIADAVEDDVLGQLYEVGALWRGIEGGARSFMGRRRQADVEPFYASERGTGF